MRRDAVVWLIMVHNCHWHFRKTAANIWVQQFQQSRRPLISLAPPSLLADGAHVIAEAHVRDQPFTVDSGTQSWFLSGVFWICLQLAGVSPLEVTQRWFSFAGRIQGVDRISQSELCLAADIVGEGRSFFLMFPSPLTRLGSQAPAVCSTARNAPVAMLTLRHHGRVYCVPCGRGHFQASLFRRAPDVALPSRGGA